MTRLRWVQAGAAGLYLGALLTGMAHGGALGFAATLAVMLLWTVLMRPATQWSGPGAAGALRFAATLATLAVLAGLLFGAGRLLALAGWIPPVWLGPGLALGGIALARALWSPEKAAELDALLDQAIAGIEAAGRGTPPEGYPMLDPDLTPIAALPDDTPDSRAQALVAAAMDQHRAHWHDAAERLVHLLDTTPGARAGRRGVILWGTDPAVASSGRHGDPLRVALEVTWADPGMLALYAPRALAAVRALPECWPDFPDPSEVEQAIDPVNDAATNAALAELSRAIRAATPEEFRGEEP